jgi:hypothetical protein
MKPTNPEYLAAFKAHMRRGEVQAAMSVGTRPMAAISLPSSGIARSLTS